MSNPVQLALTLQRAWLNAWLASTTLMLRQWSLMIDLDGQMVREAATFLRNGNEIDQGPSFTGKYGRRRSDIDPEHDV